VGAAMMRVDQSDLVVKLGHRLEYRPRFPALIAQYGGVFCDATTPEFRST